VDLARGLLHVERSWDDEEGAIDGKTKAARRTVPIASELRRYLAAHKLRSAAATDEALVFGVAPSVPFTPTTVRSRARAAWTALWRCSAGCEGDVTVQGDTDSPLCERCGKRLSPKHAPIGLHECRHTFASLMIAAGVNAKALSSYMGHASVTITYDRYGHLMPGNEDEAALLLDHYLERGQSSRGAVSRDMQESSSLGPAAVV
jgi:integrase